MEFNSVCNRTSDNKIGRPCRGGGGGESELFITSLITDRNGHEVLFPRKKEYTRKERKGNFASKYCERRHKLYVALKVIGLLNCPITTWHVN